jgi:outer membrane lipoprotein-sorting protein
MTIFLMSLSVLLQAQDADKIVREADRYRGFAGSFAQESEAIHYKNGEKESSQHLKVYIHNGEKSLVKFLGPGRDKGRIMLMTGNNIWLYIPGTRNPIRLTPQQQLLGQASNGDVARTNYSEDYMATILGKEDVDGLLCYHLELTAKQGGATYQKIEYYVALKSNRPVKALFFAKSGRLLKTGFFKNPRTFSGRVFMSELHLIDDLKKNEKTIIKVNSITREKLPDSHFHQKFLPRIR